MRTYETSSQFTVKFVRKWVLKFFLFHTLTLILNEVKVLNTSITMYFIQRAVVSIITPSFFFFFFCIPSYISGLHHSSSSSAFPAISLGFTILLFLLLPSQLHLWASPFFFFFCIPSYISGLHHSSFSSSAFPARSLGFTILILLLPSQLYIWASPFFFFFFCLPS